jgi:hypothetical protein
VPLAVWAPDGPALTGEQYAERLVRIATDPRGGRLASAYDTGQQGELEELAGPVRIWRHASGSTKRGLGALYDSSER